MFPSWNLHVETFTLGVLSRVGKELSYGDFYASSIRISFRVGGARLQGDLNASYRCLDFCVGKSVVCIDVYGNTYVEVLGTLRHPFGDFDASHCVLSIKRRAWKKSDYLRTSPKSEEFREHRLKRWDEITTHVLQDAYVLCVSVRIFSLPLIYQRYIWYIIVLTATLAQFRKRKYIRTSFFAEIRNSVPT